MTEAPKPAFDPRLLRFLLRHAATGIAAAWAFLLGLLWTDAFGLRTLLRAADEGWLGLLLIAAGFALTGGAVGMGVAVMALARRDER